MHHWELYSSALRIEYRQLLDEGYDVTQYKPLVEVIAELPPSPARDALAEAAADVPDNRKGRCWADTVPCAPADTAALLCGNPDYGRSVCMSVQPGFDTDCNGATVGSVVGMMVGAKDIPAQWAEPLNGRLETSVFGVGAIEIKELVRLTMEACP